MVDRGELESYRDSQIEESQLPPGQSPLDVFEGHVFSHFLDLLEAFSNPNLDNIAMASYVESLWKLQWSIGGNISLEDIGTQNSGDKQLISFYFRYVKGHSFDSQWEPLTICFEESNIPESAGISEGAFQGLWSFLGEVKKKQLKSIADLNQ